jgi:YVTN family beta-propeller protein
VKTIASGLAVAWALAAAPRAERGIIVTANMTAASASIVDVATGATLATIPTREGPHEVAVSHDGRWAVVSIYGNRSVTGNALVVIDLQTATAARTIDLRENLRPHGMAFLPGDRKLLVTCESRQQVLVVDFATGAVDTSIVTGQATTHMVALARDGSRAYVTNVSAGSVSAIDLGARSSRPPFVLGTRVEGIALTPDGRELWVGGNESHTVFVLDAATGAIIAQVEGFGLPYRIAIAPDGRTAVVTDPGSERIVLVDIASHSVRSRIDVPPIADSAAAAPRGASPQGIAMPLSGEVAFVTLKAAGEVSVVDIAASRIGRRLKVGGGSDGVAYAPSQPLR